LILTAGCDRTPRDMVRVPAGEFLMGTDLVDEEGEAVSLGFPYPWYEDEHPVRRLYLESFDIDITEVTHAAYAEFVKATGHALPDPWRAGGGVPADRAQHPVTHVSWYDANDYCRWRGKRLPTEEEWEKAARGPEGFSYPWGNEFDPARANLSRGPFLFGDTQPVGTRTDGESPYGAKDMIGNVWEWTDSWYLPYPGNPARHEPFGMRYRVTRGLSYIGVGHHPPEVYMKAVAVTARASYRSYDFPTSRVADVGFRCAKSAR
jgi:formylglycine-generating enzyme required for sulfatase activity